MINEQIRDREVRLIGPDGEQIGVVSAREAQKIADEAGLDLVKIAPNAKPPVCKIIDYGKYRYELARKEKEAKKKQKTIDVKEVRLSPNIDTNDLNIVVFAYIRQYLQLCGIDHRGSCTLVSGFHGKITDEGHLCSFL